MCNDELENKWTKIGLTQKLMSSNHILYEYVLNNCKTACSHLDQINQFFDEYTDHTSNHSLAVLKFGDRLTGDIVLNEIEIAIFILSCYFHDIGMNVTEDKIRKITYEPDFALEREYLIDKISARNELDTDKVDDILLNKFIMLEYIRDRHHWLSRDWINNEYAEHRNAFVEINNIKENIWPYVAKVCESHCLDLKDINEKNFSDAWLGGTKINLMFVSCLLRMSDYCHMGRDRALPFVRTAKDFYSRKSKKIWEKLASVNYVACISEKNCIEVSAECDDYDIHRALVKEADSIDTELHNQIKHLAKYKSSYQYKYYYVDSSQIKEKPDAEYIYSPARFTMNYSKITELLIGSKLYAENLYALREIIQNSRDAVSVYSLKNKLFKPYILINCFGDSQILDSIEIYDNGVGMDKDMFSNHFLSIGDDSFWVTKICFAEFGNTKELASIVASHGIGVLSYFLIANEIQVFSKYEDANPIYIKIDNYNENVVFFKTPKNEFPSFNQEICSIETPWEYGHGTCVKLTLKNKLDIRDIINFIRQHILRIGYDFYVMLNNSDVVKIPEIWMPLFEDEFRQREEFKNYTDLFAYKNIDEDAFTPEKAQKFIESVTDSGVPFGVLIKEIEDKNFLKLSSFKLPTPNNELDKETNFKEYVKKTYEASQKNLFDPFGPKEPISIELNTGDIKGKLYLENDGHKQIHNRLSQNGILVKYGNRFLDKSIAKILGTGNDIFSYDIDVIKSYRFDLNASRDEIVNNQYNKNISENLEKILISALSELIKEISFVFAFPCGNHWYHGIDLLLSGDPFDNPDSPLTVLYQKTMHQLWNISSTGKLDKQLAEKIVKSILQAKIFHAFSLHDNQAYSVVEISKLIEHFRVLIPTYVNSDKNIDGISRSNYYKMKKRGKKDLDNQARKRRERVINYINNTDKKVIVMPYYLQSFMKPLLSSLRWKIEIEDPEFVVFKFENSLDKDIKKKNIHLIRKAIKFRDEK